MRPKPSNLKRRAAGTRGEVVQAAHGCAAAASADTDVCPSGAPPPPAALRPLRSRQALPRHAHQSTETRFRGDLKIRRPRPSPCSMSQDLLDRIDQRTRLAGHNRLALLLFRLGGRQLFGVNVFKVKEVLQRPPLFTLPQLPKAFAGAADVRGRSVPVL